MSWGPRSVLEVGHVSGAMSDWPIPTLEQSIARGGCLKDLSPQVHSADARPRRTGQGQAGAIGEACWEQGIHGQTQTKHLFWVRPGSRPSKDKVRLFLIELTFHGADRQQMGPQI